MRTLLVIVALVVSGCTVAPQPIKASRPSLDGNSANSGVVGIRPNGEYELTTTAIARYEALIDAGYGKPLMPPARRGVGYYPMPNGDWSMTKQYVADFGIMVSAWRSKQKP